MFSLKSIWDRWLKADDEESLSRNHDLENRQKPPVSLDSEVPADAENPLSRPLSPEADLPDSLLWTPRLLTV